MAAQLHQLRCLLCYEGLQKVSPGTGCWYLTPISRRAEGIYQCLLRSSDKMSRKGVERKKKKKDYYLKERLNFLSFGFSILFLFQPFPKTIVY